MEIFWLNFLSAIFCFLIPGCLLLLYYFLFLKINIILIKKYWLHIILTCVSCFFLAKFQYRVLYSQYHIDLPIYISDAVYALSILSVPSLVVIVVLLLLRFFRKRVQHYFFTFQHLVDQPLETLHKYYPKFSIFFKRSSLLQRQAELKGMELTIRWGAVVWLQNKIW